MSCAVGQFDRDIGDIDAAQAYHVAGICADVVGEARGDGEKGKQRGGCRLAEEIGANQSYLDTIQQGATPAGRIAICPKCPLQASRARRRQGVGKAVGLGFA